MNINEQKCTELYRDNLILKYSEKFLQKNPKKALPFMVGMNSVCNVSIGLQYMF